MDESLHHPSQPGAKVIAHDPKRGWWITEWKHNANSVVLIENNVDVVIAKSSILWHRDVRNAGGIFAWAANELKLSA